MRRMTQELEGKFTEAEQELWESSLCSWDSAESLHVQHCKKPVARADSMGYVPEALFRPEHAEYWRVNYGW